MKKILLLFYIYTGIVIASILIFTIGSTGLLSYRNLQDHKAEMARNIEELEAINESLKLQLSMLRSDPETNMIEARKLDYIGEGEVLIQMDDYHAGNNFYRIGKILKFRMAKRDANVLYKLIGLSIILCLFLLHILLSLRRRRIGNGNQAR